MSFESDSYESNTHVLMVKIWLEESQTEGKAKWRGHVTDLTSGERRYVEDLFDIIHIIIPYLVRMGVKISRFWQLESWLKRKRNTSGFNYPKNIP